MVFEIILPRQNSDCNITGRENFRHGTNIFSGTKKRDERRFSVTYGAVKKVVSFRESSALLRGNPPVFHTFFVEKIGFFAYQGDCHTSDIGLLPRNDIIS